MLTLLALYEMKSGRIDPSRFLCLAALGLISACGPRSSATTLQPGARHSSLFLRTDSKADSRFRERFTKAQGNTIHGVCVNLRQADLVIDEIGETLQVGLGRDFGMVDLLSLDNPLIEAMYDVHVPDGTRVSQVRLQLEPFGHYLLSGQDGHRDYLPHSYDSRGLEMIVKEMFSSQKGTRYSVAVQANTPARQARPSAMTLPAARARFAS